MTSVSFNLVLVLGALPQNDPLSGTRGPGLEEALAWLKSLDRDPASAQKQPRFPTLTVDGLKALKEIRLGGHRASDGRHVFIEAAGFRHLPALPALEKANLVEIDGFTDEALGHVCEVVTLTDLNLGDAWVTDAGLPKILKLMKLRRLDLGWTRDVGDPSLPVLAKLPDLESLGLGGTKITDAGLAVLATFPSLKELSLPGTAVTDRGLEALAASKTLTRLTLGKKMAVTPAGLDRLRKAIPGLTVVVQ